MQRRSNIRVDPSQPWWSDYLSFLDHVTGGQTTDCEQLNSLLPEGLKTESGHSVRFVPSNELEDGAYEQRIYTTGQVSTRPDSWHDLFNALVWMRFPRIKTAMNALHCQAWSDRNDGGRGPVRDALTLFDECGVIVFSAQLDLLTTLAQRRWSEAFLADDFSEAVQLSICGHALLEKYLSPYKSMTAKALLVQVPSKFMNLSRREMLARLDAEIAKRMLAGQLLTGPACLSPLPLAGIPGWWPGNRKDANAFYHDLEVFRPPQQGLKPVAVIRI